MHKEGNVGHSTYVFLKFLFILSQNLQGVALLSKLQNPGAVHHAGHSVMTGRLQKYLSLQPCPFLLLLSIMKMKTQKEYTEIFPILSLMRKIINLVTSAFFLPFLFFYSNVSSVNPDSNSKKLQSLI